MSFRERTAGRNALAVFLIVLIVLNLAFIWVNSAKISSESNKSSHKIAETVVKKTVKNYNSLPKTEQQKKIRAANTKIRSLAHFAEFIPLGALVLLLALNLLFCDRRRRLLFVSVCVALIFCVLCALFDEVHQLFIKGRSFEVKDILTDSLGSLVGIILVGVIFAASSISRQRKKI